MSENYKFSETRDSIESFELGENEIKIINNLGLTPEDLQKLLDGSHFAEGSYALVFELPSNENIVAKVWKNPTQDSGRAKNENVALRLLRMHNSVEAPCLKGYLKSSAILFEEKIEGSPIEEFDKKTINQLAETLAKVHSIELNAYGKPLSQRNRGTQMDCLNDGIEKLRGSLASLSNVPEVISTIERALDKIESEATRELDAFQGNIFTLIHFDLNRNNILQAKDSNKIILIDWEQASAGDNAMDIAKLFLKLNFDEEQKNEFLAEYEKKLHRKDEYFDDRLIVYEPLVLINSILWRLHALNNPLSQRSSETEEQFYDRVKNGFDSEFNMLQKFVNEPNK